MPMCCGAPGGGKSKKPHSSVARMTRKAGKPAARVSEPCAPISSGAPGRRGWQNNLPVVIVPGFCSSGLKVQKSTVHQAWENERVWLSLQKLGKQKLAGSRKAADSNHGQLHRSTLLVHIHRARHLPAGDANGKSDPYVRLQLLGGDGQPMRGQRETTVKSMTLNPTWDEKIVLGSDCELYRAEELQLTVIDADKWSSGEFLGGVRIPCHQLVPPSLADLDNSGSEPARTDELNGVRGWHCLQPAGQSSVLGGKRRHVLGDATCGEVRSFACSPTRSRPQVADCACGLTRPNDSHPTRRSSSP